MSVEIYIDDLKPDIERQVLLLTAFVGQSPALFDV